MLDLQTAFENFSPDLDLMEPSIDTDFITNFLLPYFHGLPREQLEAKLAEIISLEKERSPVPHRARERRQ